MPCRIKIKENLEGEVYDFARPGTYGTAKQARDLAVRINQMYGDSVVKFTRSEADILNIDVTISESLIDRYYANELRLEEEEARHALRADATRAGVNYTDDYLFQVPGRSNPKAPTERQLENTVDSVFTNEELENRLGYKAGLPYIVLSEKSTESFNKYVSKTRRYDNKAILPKKWFDEKTPDIIYIKSNNRKNSTLYDVVDYRTGEILRSKVRLYLFDEFENKNKAKEKIADEYGVNFTPTKVFNANRSIAFSLYKQMPSKAKYIAQAKRYLYDAIKMVGSFEEGGAVKPYINLSQIETLLQSLPDGIWDYINTTYDPEDRTNINASLSLMNNIRFNLPKLGFIQEVEKITGIPLIGVTFKNYDRSGGLKKATGKDWGEVITIDPGKLSTLKLHKVISYYLEQEGYFKKSTEEQNIRKWAEHNGWPIETLKKVMVGDEAYEHITHNYSKNSNTIELAKWREEVRNYNWQAAELFEKPYSNFNDTVSERIRKKFKDSVLPNGIPYLDQFFSGNMLFLNINFNNISGQYYRGGLNEEGVMDDIKSPVGPRYKPLKNGGFIQSFVKPVVGKDYLTETEVYNRLAAIIHEPFHALHALTYGTKEEMEMRVAFDKLYNTDFGQQMLTEAFGSGYGNRSLDYATLYKEFTAFTFQLMMYPKEWIQKTDLRSNDIFDFISKIQNLQDKTYEELVTTYGKIGTTEKTVQETEEIKISFLEKLYNLIVKALNAVIPLSKKFVKLIETSRIVEKTVVEDVFGETEGYETRTVALPKNVRIQKEKFLDALDEVKAAINTLMSVDNTMLNSQNIGSFFSGDNTGFSQEANIKQQDVSNYELEIAKDFELSVKGSQQARANEIAFKLGEKFKTAFNIEYQQVSSDYAYELLKDTKTPYTGEPAFYFNNVVYFVDGNFNIGSVFHEYSHPFLQAIRRDNPVLFDKLYAQLSNTFAGNQIISDLVDEQKTKLESKRLTGDRFKEEALVRAMEYNAQKKLDKVVESDSAFKAFISNLLYAIKKIIQKLVGKVDLGKLSTDTTLDDLVDMMLTKEFRIETEALKNSDVAEFSKNAKTDIEKLVDELKNTDAQDFIDAFNKFYTGIDYQLKQLEKTPKDVQRLLQKGEADGTIDGRRLLRNVKNYMSKGQTVYTNLSEINPEELIEAIRAQEKEFNKRAINMIKSINEIEVFARRIQTIVKDMRTKKIHLKPDGMAVVDYYISFMEEQGRFIDDILKTLKLDEETAFTKKLLSIERVIKNSLGDASKLRFDGMVNWFTENADLVNQSIEGKLESKLMLILSPQGFTEKEIKDYISNLKTRKNLDKFSKADVDLGKPVTSDTLIAEAVRNFGKKYITAETISRMLKGEGGDINTISANILSYTNINDQMGIFYREMKNELSNAAAKSHQQEIELVKAILPYLKAVGYNPNNTHMLADLMTFVDTIAVVEDGELKRMEIRSVLDKFINWRADKGELEYALEEAREKKDRAAIKKAMQDLWNFHNTYMNRQYKDEVYTVQNIWRQSNTVYDPVTKTNLIVSADESTEAYLERQEALDQMSLYSSTTVFTELDDLYEEPESKEARREYQQLYELYDSFGVEKSEEERKKVLVRQLYRKESKKFYQAKINYDQFQRDFDNFVLTELASEGIDMDDVDFDKYIQKFIDKNTRIAYSDKYYDDLEKIFDTIKTLTEKAKNNAVSLQLGALYKQRAILVNVVSDKNGTPDGVELNPAQRKKLLEIEKEIVELQEKYDRQTGIDKADIAWMAGIEKKMKLKKPIDPVDMEKYTTLFNIKNELGLNKQDNADLRAAFAELSDLRETLATDQYTSAFDNTLGDATAILEEKGMLEAKDFPGGKIVQLTKENADEWINSPILKKVMAVNPEFSSWFNANHYLKPSYDQATNSYIPKYVRLKAWSVTRPIDPDHYEMTDLINPITKKPIKVQGVPVGKYSYRTIKDEYRTIPKNADRSAYVGTIIDNQGNYLPKVVPIGSPNDKYMNKEYFELMKNPNSARFKLIEEYKKQYLNIQKDRPYSSKLYLDTPRMRINENMEYLQSGNAKNDAYTKLEQIKQASTSLFRSTTDDREFGLNADVSTQLIATDINGKPITRIPVRGMYKLQLSETTTDILGVTSTYLYSLNEQEALIKNEPLGKAIIKILSDPENGLKDMSKVSRDIQKTRGEEVYLPAATKTYQRLKANQYYIDRLFYGQAASDFQQNNPALTKVIKALMGRASGSFINLDIQSALKNRYGMTFQKMVEVAGGQYISYQSMARGKLKAFKTTVELSSKGIYQVGPKSLFIQMVERFDPVTGKTKKDFGKSNSRTFMKDMLDMTFLLDGRKLLEFNSGLEIFFGMMEHKQIPITRPDGKVEKIRYVDAWEMGPDDIIKLKDGIDPEWDHKPISHEYTGTETLEEIAKLYSTTVEAIKAKNKIKSASELEPGDKVVISTAKLFNDFKLKIQGTGKRLNGMIAEEDNPQANQYILYNLFSFYKKFALPMFLNRFQTDLSKENRWGEVYDWDMGTTTKGYYITGIQTIIKLIKNFKEVYPAMDVEEKTAIKKMASESLMLLAMALVGMFLFGYDPGDEDRFNKLKAIEERYGGLGWLSNEALYLLIMTKRENQMFIPLPGVGFDEWLSLTDSTSIATGPTLELYSKIFMDIIYWVTGSEKARYKQDVGPYSWQTEGSLKLLNHIGSIWGIKGKNLAPIWAIKKAEAFDALN